MRRLLWLILTAMILPGCARGITDNCGNGVCDANETPTSCAADCMMAVCGDGLCTPPETNATCPLDCTGLPNCGNGLCDAGEDATNCPVDCVATPICMNGLCEAGEAMSCPADCPLCPNGTCDPGEDNLSCPADCPAGPVCGNAICEAGEDELNCPADCMPVGTDSGSGMVWIPPMSDGVACAPEACPVDAPHCFGPDEFNAYCRADCNFMATPDPCAPNYDCLELTSGVGACVPAAATNGCCNACGCQPGDVCVAINMASPVCLVECDPANPIQCVAGEACIMLTGGTTTWGGACLPTPNPACSGNPASETNCI